MKILHLTLLILLLSASAARSNFNWLSVNPYPGASDIRHVAYGNGIWLGHDGTTMYSSTDLSHWSGDPLAGLGGVKVGLHFDGTYFYTLTKSLSNDDLYIIRSRNGRSWSVDQHLPGTSGYQPQQFVRGGGKWIVFTRAFGEDMNVWVNSGGQGWSQGAVEAGDTSGGIEFTDAVYFKGRYIVSTYSGELYSSSDGLSWDKYTTDRSLYRLAMSADKVVAAGNIYGEVIYSTDGQTWNRVTPAIGGFGYFSVVYNPATDEFVFGEINNKDGAQLFSAPASGSFETLVAHGRILRDDADVLSAYRDTYDIATDGSTYLGGGDNGLLFTASVDLAPENQIERSQGFRDPIVGIAMGDDRIVVVTNSRAFVSTDNGLTLVEANKKNFFATNGVFYHAGKFITYGGQSHYSSDGMDWTVTEHGDRFFRLQAVNARGAGFIGVAEIQNADYSRSLVFAESDDGINWQTTLIDKTFSGQVNGILEVEGLIYIATTSFGGLNIYRTGDFSSWEPEIQIANYVSSQARMEYHNGAFLVNGENEVVSSQDGETWVKNNDVWASASWYRGAWYSFDSFGKPIASTDGATWSVLAEEPYDRLRYYGGVQVTAKGWLAYGEFSLVRNPGIPALSGTPAARWNQVTVVSLNWSWDPTLHWFKQTESSDWIYQPALGWLRVEGDYNPNLYLFSLLESQWLIIHADEPGYIYNPLDQIWHPFDGVTQPW